MDDKKIQKIKDIIQSSNINFLLGSGLSFPFLPTLNDIESRLNFAKSEKERYEICKEYYEKIMLPNTRILSNSLKTAKDASGQTEAQNYEDVLTQYKLFFSQIANILFERKGTILSKQANVFTTNIDIFSETSLEEGNFFYNDGFSGSLDPTYNISNFKQIIHKKSLHFDNTSEIPSFNLVKVHGSLTWILNDESKKITYTKLNHITEDLVSQSMADFQKEYEKILIVNPENSKLQKTVIDVLYYELLRFYSAELEKENAVLFVLGFSMDDEHIKEITLRSANSNPTLTIYIFCHSKSGAEAMKKKIGSSRYNNIEFIEPEDDDAENKLNFKKINEDIFKKLLPLKTNGFKKDE